MLDDVRLLTAGYCLVPEALARRGAPFTRSRFPAGFALLVHRQQGAVLFDTGYSQRFLEQTRSFPYSLYARATPATIPEADEAHRQLAALGVAAADVRWIVVSHFHADHIAGLRDFPRARIVCSRTAWATIRRARGVNGVLHGLLPGLLPPDIEQRLQFVEACAPAPLPSPMDAFGQARDVFGDGSLLAVDLPGHASGQVGLLLPETPRGPLFLVADAAWSRQAIATGTPPPAITTALLGHTRTYQTTLARLTTLTTTWPSLTLLPSHAPPDTLTTTGQTLGLLPHARPAAGADMPLDGV